jgi:Putative transposase
VFRYLGRYSHRVAISNHRLREVTDTHVQFDWKDYAGGNRVRQMRLDIDEFIRRFLLHVLPKGFVRIRHYGLLASVNVAGKLEQCRRLLGGDCRPKPATAAKTWIERVLEWTGQDLMACPRCQDPLTRRELLDPCDRGATPARLERTANGQQAVPTNSS